MRSTDSRAAFFMLLSAATTAGPSLRFRRTTGVYVCTHARARVCVCNDNTRGGQDRFTVLRARECGVWCVACLTTVPRWYCTQHQQTNEQTGWLETVGRAGAVAVRAPPGESLRPWIRTSGGSTPPDTIHPPTHPSMHPSIHPSIRVWPTKCDTYYMHARTCQRHHAQQQQH